MAVVNVLQNYLRIAARRIGLRNPLAHHRPTNLSLLAASEADIDYQIAYGIRNGELNAWRLGQLGVGPGARVMEVGPGVAFGGMAYLLAMGMRVSVSDRWLAPWSETLHRPVYAGIADRIAGKPGFDVAPLRRMIAANGYVDGIITCIFKASEDLATVGLAPFDAIVSNAVLEHVENLPQAMASLFELTATGGVGLHQIDFRDHRNFARPLDHLLTPKKFGQQNAKVHFEFGSLRRLPDYVRDIQGAGFRIEKYDANSLADFVYVDTVLAALRRKAGKGKPAWSRAVLADLGGIFALRRP